MLAIVTGSGRCGTNSVAAFLNGQSGINGRQVVARHETGWREIVADIARSREDLVDGRLSSFDHDIEVSPFLLLLKVPPLAAAKNPPRLVGLMRDGRQTVRSGMTNGWYWNPEGDPAHWVNLMPRFDGDRFEPCCQFWTWSYKRLAGWDATIIRLEDLIAGPAGRHELLAATGLAKSNGPFVHQNWTPYDSFGTLVDESEASWPLPLPAAEHWTKRQHEIFRRHCGEVMDECYPGWRKRP